MCQKTFVCTHAHIQISSSHLVRCNILSSDHFEHTVQIFKKHVCQYHTNNEKASSLQAKWPLSKWPKIELQGSTINCIITSSSLWHTSLWEGNNCYATNPMYVFQQTTFGYKVNKMQQQWMERGHDHWAQWSWQRVKTQRGMLRDDETTVNGKLKLHHDRSFHKRIPHFSASVACSQAKVWGGEKEKKRKR